MFILVWFERSLHSGHTSRTKMSLNIKTDDVTSGRRDVDLHRQLRAALKGANGLNIFLRIPSLFG